MTQSTHSPPPPYTLHLGFQWGSPFLGALWGWTTSDDYVSTKYRFLQYALADPNGKSSWFLLPAGAGLAVTIWDLTPSPSSSRSVKNLYISLSDLDSSETYDPSTYMILEPAATKATTTDAKTQNTQSYFEFSSISGSQLSGCPWGDSYTSAFLAGTVHFKPDVNFQCKLSFYVEVDDSDAQYFISDPEVIVSSNGKST